MPESRQLTLDNQLCVSLYDASRAIVGCYRPGLERMGLTYSQYVVLLVLWERESLTLGELGAAVHLDSGTLSPLLKRLEAAGVVTRRRSTADERVLEVAITEHGASLYDRACEVQSEVEAMTGLSRDELVALRDTLRTLTGRLRDAAGRAATAA